MGFITTINYRTGKEVYACEFGKSGCNSYPCKAHKCPYNYCQRYYSCNNCWQQVKSEWKQAHAKCEPAHREFVERQQKQAELIESGKYLRCAALGHGGYVKVIFRGKDDEIAYLMAPETYHAYPYLEPTTPEDYAKVGTILRAENTDIYASA